METGKTRRHLKYAIGEIILVVIGILIALQINNWNENRKDKIKEHAYLSNLKKDISKDIVINTYYILDRYQKKVEVLKKGKAFYQGKYIVKDTISFLNDIGYGNVFGNVIWAFNKATYNQLVNTGDFKVIESDTLKTSILNYYNRLNARERSSQHKPTGYIKFTNSLAPFNREDPKHISDFDAKFFISKVNSEEFYRLANLELTLAHEVKDNATVINEKANELIKLIETYLND
jgi:hypothetical protein